MRAVVIVQARLGSSRLPGKSLMALAGRPMLAHVLERACALPGVADVVMATSVSDRDAALLAVAAAAGVRAHRGSEQDVLARTCEAARLVRADVVVRVTGDCPFWDPEIGAAVVRHYLAVPASGFSALDYASNDVACSGYPDGTDTEVFSMAALEQADAVATQAADREHVTPWIRRNARAATVACATGDWSSLKLSVDREADYRLACALVARLRPGDYSLAGTLLAYEAHMQEQAGG